MNTDGYKAGRIIDSASEEAGWRAMPKELKTQVQPCSDGKLVEGSNTDLVRETVNQIQALHSYRANLSVAKTAAEMLEETTEKL